MKNIIVKALLGTLAKIAIGAAIKKYEDKKSFKEMATKAAIHEAEKAVVAAKEALERAAEAHFKTQVLDDSRVRDAAWDARVEASKAYDEARAALKAVSK